MRVKVRLTAEYLQKPRNGDTDEWENTSAPMYEVSSATELFDRLMRMRHLKGLVEIKVMRAFPFSMGVTVATIFPFYRPVNESSTKRAVKITDEKLADPESLDAFAGEVWDVILSHRYGQGINRE